MLVKLKKEITMKEFNLIAFGDLSQKKFYRKSDLVKPLKAFKLNNGAYRVNIPFAGDCNVPLLFSTENYQRIFESVEESEQKEST